MTDAILTAREAKLLNGDFLCVGLAYWSWFTNSCLLTVSSHNNLLSSDKGACSIMDSIPVFFANSFTSHHCEMCLQPMVLGCSGFLSCCYRMIPHRSTQWNDACILSHNSRLQPTTAASSSSRNLRHLATSHLRQEQRVKGCLYVCCLANFTALI